MLDGVAVYLTLAPLVATVALGALLVAFWLGGRQPAPARIHIPGVPAKSRGSTRKRVPGGADFVGWVQHRR